MAIQAVLRGQRTMQADIQPRTPLAGTFQIGSGAGSAAIEKHNADPEAHADIRELITDMRSSFFVISDTVPTGAPCLWFNTAPGGAINNEALLTLVEDESNHDVYAVVGDETYGIDNATVNSEPTAGKYNFTVL